MRHATRDAFITHHHEIGISRQSTTLPSVDCHRKTCTHPTHYYLNSFLSCSLHSLPMSTPFSGSRNHLMLLPPPSPTKSKIVIENVEKPLCACLSTLLFTPWESQDFGR